jgi:predicted amidophosphoribosyltransferase
MYDDRMTRVLRAVGTGIAVDIRELVIQTTTTAAAHMSTHDRPSPEEIATNYEIDVARAQPAPRLIGVFDDVLTTGAHFRAMKTVLQTRFPGTSVIGVFLARRVFPAQDPDLSSV